jgi:hypothetical protein
MSGKIHLRFYEELNDYLPPGKRKVEFEHAFEGHLSILDLLRVFNIPPEKVDLVLADGTSVDFSHRLRDGERISLYPVFELLDIRSVSRLRPIPLRETKFLAGAGLHGLARHLRLCGFDTCERENAGPDELIRLAEAEGRILLLRGAGVSRQGAASRIWCARVGKPRLQLLEVLEGLDLFRSIIPLSRCPSCNHPLGLSGKQGEEQAGQPARPLQLPLRCFSCGRQLGQGPHFDRLLRWLERVTGSRTGS